MSSLIRNENKKCTFKNEDYHPLKKNVWINQSNMTDDILFPQDNVSCNHIQHKTVVF